MLTRSVNLTFGVNRASKINVGLVPGSGLLFLDQAGFGLQNEAHLQPGFWLKKYAKKIPIFQELAE